MRWTMVQETEVRKAIGLRIKELRKQRNWTQKDLAGKIGVRFGQLNKYESGLHTPPVDKLIHLAEIFHVTLDYLLTGNTSGEQLLHNLRLMERFRALEKFENEEQEALIRLIDAVIVKNRMEGALKSADLKAI